MLSMMIDIRTPDGRGGVLLPATAPPEMVEYVRALLAGGGSPPEADGNLPMPAGAVSPLAAVAHLMGPPPDEPTIVEGPPHG